MQIRRKQLMRLAARIQQRLTRGQPNTEMALPVSAWQQAVQQADRINKSKQFGWHLAAARCTKDLEYRLNTFRDEVTTLINRLNIRQSEPSVVSLTDIYHDLVALHDEFDSLTWDTRRGRLSATTEPIVLEGIDLGCFEIRLDWRDLSEPDSYRVIAMDPNPASSNSSVTHPHVQDESVCEGEGRQPIRQALQQGRLLDFFLIVANLLRTYSPDSPYVSLSDWHGQLCADCSTVIGDDDKWTCEKCESTVCEECYYSCSDCDGIYCCDCVLCCESCDQSHCGGCTKSCNHCSCNTCQSCLDESERCKSCHEKLATQHDHEKLSV